MLILFTSACSSLTPARRLRCGNFVFVVENNVARVRPVTVARTIEGEAVIAEGLNGGETVVTDGQVALRDGSRVDVKRAPGA